MTLRHMKIFIAVYQNESITRAAAKLYMTQPAVTRAIHEIESEYGVRLFDRINQRISITEAAKKLYAYTLHIIDSYEHMETELKNWDELGVIRIGASATLGSILLPKVLKAFKEIYPNITIKSMVSSGMKLQHCLENNELDFALIEGGIENDNLLAEAFWTDRLILLLPTDSPMLNRKSVRMEDLQEQPLIVSEKDTVTRVLLDHVYAMHSLRMEPFMESINSHAIVQFVHAGLGISFLPEKLVHHSVESGFIASMPIADESLSRTNYIVRHKNKLMTKAAETLYALCHEHAKEMTV